MITERLNDGFDTLLEAIQGVKQKGFTIEFICTENGFYDAKSDKTYLPESVCKMEFIRIYSPLSEPDEESIIYLLEIMDGKKGWISDSFGYNANQKLTEHINRIKENFSCKK